MLRSTLLLAGFYVGAGSATGTKEETTIAAIDLALIAEPLREPVSTRAPLSSETAEELREHPQFDALPARR